VWLFTQSLGPWQREWQGGGDHSGCETTAKEEVADGVEGEVKVKVRVEVCIGAGSIRSE
jgi:hypothetical protein